MSDIELLFETGYKCARRGRGIIKMTYSRNRFKPENLLIEIMVMPHSTASPLFSNQGGNFYIFNNCPLN